jgi:hypothetical protein
MKGGGKGQEGEGEEIGEFERLNFIVSRRATAPPIH